MLCRVFAAMVMLTLILHVKGQLINLSTCPTVSAMKGFSISKFSGKWYEIRRLEAVHFPNQKCLTTNFEVLSDGKVNATVSRIVLLPLRKNVTIKYHIVYEADQDKGILISNFKVGPFKFFSMNLHILDTDYENYAVVWSCSQLPILPVNVYSEQAFIMSRQSFLSDDKVKEILKTMKQQGINTDLMRPVTHKGCSAARTLQHQEYYLN